MKSTKSRTRCDWSAYPQVAATAAPGTMGRVAAEHGYADQSHLVRDFVAFSGRSPTKWLAEEFGNVQAKGAPGGRD